MMRVCGVTFDHTTNYGSCLQAYALQTVIDHIIINNETCSYALLPANIIIQNSKAKKDISKKPLRFKVKQCIIRELNHYRRQKFRAFENRYMHYDNSTDIQQLEKLNQCYDAFICGSDVIWNLDFTYANSLFFLDFAHKYKFSYAASFGVCDIDHDFEKWNSERTPREVYKQYLPELDQISVREKNSLNIVYELTGKEAKCVCDPVMLLSAEEWNSIIEEGSKRKDYIFAYSTYTSPNYQSFLKKLHKQTGLPVVQVTWDIKSFIKCRAFTFPEPQKWLELLKNAKFVVTNSFHATAFSCIFHKTFFCPMRDNRIVGTRIRLYDLLDALCIDGRIYGNTPNNIDLSSPDFTESDKKLNVLRETSYQYIQSNLELALLERQNSKHS